MSLINGLGHLLFWENANVIQTLGNHPTKKRICMTSERVTSKEQQKVFKEMLPF